MRKQGISAPSGRSVVILLIGAFLALGVLFTGGSVSAQGDAKLAELTPIKMLSVAYFAPELIAHEKGFFTKYNLDVELVKTVAQGTAGIPAIVAGHVQTGQGFGAPPIIQALSGGARITTVFAGIISTDGDFRLYSLADSGIKTAQDVMGKTAGIANPGSYADFALRGFIQGAGLEFSKVRRLTVPLPAMCQALLTKQVDLVAMYSLFYIPCVRQNPGKLHLLAKDNEGLPASSRLYSAYVFADKYLEARPDVVRAFIAAMNDATKFVQENPEAAKKIISARTGIAADLLQVPTFAKGGCVDAAAAAEWVETLSGFEAIKRGSVSPDGWFTNRYNPNCS